MTELSNTLADLAEQVKEAGASVAKAERETIESAIVAGTLLCKAKTQCRHGEWYPFLKRAEIHERQASRLMQIAQSGLKSDTCLELGGIKATLAYIAKLDLPGPDQMLLIRDAEVDGAGAMVKPSEEPGFYHVTIVDTRDPSPFVEETEKPVPGQSLFVDGRYVNMLWLTIDQSLCVPPSARKFSILPAWSIEDDLAFLKETPDHNLDTGTLNISGAPLPRSYDEARKAMEHFLAHPGPVTYRTADLAMAIALKRTEEWPSGDTRMLATLAKIAGDDSFTRLAARFTEVASQLGEGASV